jgi:hypothetical protein
MMQQRDDDATNNQQQQSQKLDLYAHLYSSSQSKVPRALFFCSKYDDNLVTAGVHTKVKQEVLF